MILLVGGYLGVLGLSICFLMARRLQRRPLLLSAVIVGLVVAAGAIPAAAAVVSVVQANQKCAATVGCGGAFQLKLDAEIPPTPALP